MSIKSELEELQVHKVRPVVFHTFSPEVQAIVSLEIYTVSSRCLGKVQLVKTEWKVRWRWLNYIISFAFLYMNRNIKLRNSKKC